jgi:hypothetical protein
MSPPLAVTPAEPVFFEAGPLERKQRQAPLQTAGGTAKFAILKIRLYRY